MRLRSLLGKNNGISTEISLFAVFLITVIIVRMYAFFHPIEWDESLYAVIARDFLRGHQLYTLIPDHKPPGIFLIYAAIFKIFGSSYAAVRAAACFSCALSAYFISRIGRIVFPADGRIIGIIAGFIYAVFCVTNGGQASNAEIFFTPFSTLGFFLIFSQHLRGNKYSAPVLVLAGIILGVGFQIKYVVLFEAALFTVFLCFGAERGSNGLKKAALVICGFLVPSIAVLGYFILCGAFQDYFFSTARCTGQYVMEGFSPDPTKAEWVIKYLLGSVLLWGGFITGLFCAVSSFSLRRAASPPRILFYWLIATLIVASGRILGHYMLQALPPLCLIAAHTVKRYFRRPRQAAHLAVLLILSYGIAQSFCIVYNSLWHSYQGFRQRYFYNDRFFGDPEARIADYLSTRVRKEDYVWSVNGYPGLYFLLDCRIPTRFPMPLFYSIHLWKKGGQEAEIPEILRRRPKYIILNKDLPLFDDVSNARLRTHLNGYYTLEAEIHSARIYRLNGSSVPGKE